MRARVREERFQSEKARAKLRILFASDLHLGLPWTRRAATELVRFAEATSPDVVLLGGDLVDNRRGLDAMEACVEALASRSTVAAVPGNHDTAAGVEEVRRRAVRAGARWLPDEPLIVGGAAGQAVRVCGGSLDGVDHDRINVACLHDPARAEAARRAGFDLAFAGHLHGGQCVLFERGGRQYPGAWFNRWTGRRFQVGSLSMIVSSGLGDTLPLRFNCPREVVLCEVEGT